MLTDAEQSTVKNLTMKPCTVPVAVFPLFKVISTAEKVFEENARQNLDDGIKTFKSTVHTGHFYRLSEAIHESGNAFGSGRKAISP